MDVAAEPYFRHAPFAKRPFEYVLPNSEIRLHSKTSDGSFFIIGGSIAWCGRATIVVVLHRASDRLLTVSARKRQISRSGWDWPVICFYMGE